MIFAVFEIRNKWISSKKYDILFNIKYKNCLIYIIRINYNKFHKKNLQQTYWLTQNFLAWIYRDLKKEIANFIERILFKLIILIVKFWWGKFHESR